MKRKTRFQEGGSTGRFEEDLYARARRFVEEQERRAGEGLALTGDETPKVAPRPAKVSAPLTPPPVSDTYREEGVGRGRPAPAEIPVDTSMRGPAKQFSSAMEMGDVGRNLSTTIGALGGAGPAAIRGAATLPRVASTASEMAKGIAAPLTRAAKEGLEVARTVGPKEGLETARSTLRGMKSRADIQAKRTARQKAEAEELEKAKPILQARKSDKTSRAARTRRTEEDFGMEFSKGGSASSRADGCAKRGKTRGKMY